MRVRASALVADACAEWFLIRKVESEPMSTFVWFIVLCAPAVVTGMEKWIGFTYGGRLGNQLFAWANAAAIAAQFDAKLKNLRRPSLGASGSGLTIPSVTPM